MALTRGDQGRFIDDVAQVGPHQAGRRARNIAQIHPRVEPNVAGVDPQNRLTADAIGGRHGDPPVEAAGPEQGGIQDFGAVGRGQHDDTLVGREAIHLGQDLIERLLPFVVRTEGGG